PPGRSSARPPTGPSASRCSWRAERGERAEATWREASCAATAAAVATTCWLPSRARAAVPARGSASARSAPVQRPWRGPVRRSLPRSLGQRCGPDRADGVVVGQDDPPALDLDQDVRDVSPINVAREIVEAHVFAERRAGADAQRDGGEVPVL